MGPVNDNVYLVGRRDEQYVYTHIYIVLALECWSYGVLGCGWCKRTMIAVRLSGAIAFSIWKAVQRGQYRWCLGLLGVSHRRRQWRSADASLTS